MRERMKAYVLHGVQDLRYEKAPVPELTEGTALLRVHAAGICGSDIPRIFQNGTYHFPTIPGHEFSGEVVDVRGTEEDRRWIGRRVGVFPLIPCGNCLPCWHRRYEMCQSYSYLGSREDGGFAEYVRVPLWNLIELPENVTYEQAAMLEPLAVALHAIRRAMGAEPVARDAAIVICGLGTIGMMTVVLLRGMGYRNVTGIGNKDFQKAVFDDMVGPAGHFIDSREEDPAEEIKSRTVLGADLLFECVGRNDTMVPLLEAAAPGGRIQLVGNPFGDMHIPRNHYWQILRKQLTVTGTWNSSFLHDPADDWHSVMAVLESGKIHPEKLITHRLLPDELMRGFTLMWDKSEPYLKVMGIFEKNFSEK